MKCSAIMEALTHQEFLEQFEALILPTEAFTHVAHLRLCWLYLQHNSPIEAEEKVCLGLQRMVQKHESDKYHETITRALVRIIYRRMMSRAYETFEAFMAAHPELVDDWREVLLVHYHSKTLYSLAAKVDFITPDRQAF